MSMGTPETNPDTEIDAELEDDEEIEEIAVEITEDDMIWVHGTDWEIFLSPAEARELGDALRDAADDAESPAEE